MAVAGVLETEADLAAVTGRCFRQFALTAAGNVKSLFVLLVKNRYFAMTVFEKTAATPDPEAKAQGKDPDQITRPSLTL